MRGKEESYKGEILRLYGNGNTLPNDSGNDNLIKDTINSACKIFFSKDPFQQFVVRDTWVQITSYEGVLRDSAVE